MQKTLIFIVQKLLRMRTLFVGFLMLLLTLGVLWSCQKEISYDPSNPAGTGNGNGSGGSGGGGSTSALGWSFTGPSSANYKGCIDTAFYSAIGTAKSLTIDGTDSAGDFFSVVLFALNGSFSTTTYTPAGGSQMTFSKSS